LERPDETEYGDAMVAALELVWGEGFLSPGGPAEVAEILEGRGIRGAELLDIGCGIGGVDLLIAERHGAAKVIGIDIEAGNIARARLRAERRGLSNRVAYRLVAPGNLPFAPNSFDVVFSKDAIIHIPDKEALFRDVFALLRPGGRFIASDWLRVDDGPASAEMARYIESEGLTFAMASAARYRQAMEAAGFLEIEMVDRNRWYAQTARAELAAIQGPIRSQLVELAGKAEADRQTRVWQNMIVVLDSGELRPTHMFGRKPSAS
jgi:SAM-dependent methyltransferase